MNCRRWHSKNIQEYIRSHEKLNIHCAIGSYNTPMLCGGSTEFIHVINLTTRTSLRDFHVGRQKNSVKSNPFVQFFKPKPDLKYFQAVENRIKIGKALSEMLQCFAEEEPLECVPL